ncbi:hypothetical protein MPSEU_000436200 [Mayamaea pseudoterrestris]|nr:hypothetical protein MPSEU_000436200 [Mayamaea pseudoterrestris]
MNSRSAKNPSSNPLAHSSASEQPHPRSSSNNNKEGTEIPSSVSTGVYSINSSNSTTPAKKTPSMSGMSLLQLVTQPKMTPSKATSSPSSNATSLSNSVTSPDSTATSPSPTSPKSARGTFWRPRRISKDELLSQQNRLVHQHARLREEMDDDDNNNDKNSRMHRDESSSNVDDEDDAVGGVIAIGIAMPSGRPSRSNSNESKDEIASFQVARDLAKEEHRIKSMSRASAVDTTGAAAAAATARLPMAISGSAAHGDQIELSSWKEAPKLSDGPSLAAGSFQDVKTDGMASSGGDASMMSAKQREKMERERAAASMAAGASKKIAPSDSKVALASVQSSQQRVSSIGDSRMMSADESSKARARESARAAGLARSVPSQTASSRVDKEAQKMAAERNDGPSLAPMVSGAIVSHPPSSISLAAVATTSSPGAFASSNAPAREEAKQRSMVDNGPSLAPAEFSTVTSAAFSPSIMVPPAAEEPHVGAYAIEGMNASNDDDLSDDEFSITDQNRPYMHDVESGYDDVFYVDPDAQAMESALDAELQVVVDGNVLTEEDDEALDPKVIKRLRMYQRAAPPSLGWVQVGPTLYGSHEAPQVFFGQSLDMTSDGRRLVVAVPGFDDEATQSTVGQVRIFDQVAGVNGSEWHKNGEITGKQTSTGAQMAVTTSKDGNRFAVGQSQVGSGIVEVYDVQDKGWSLSQNFSIGTDLESESWFGHAVALTSDGSVLVASAPLSDTNVGLKSGFVRAFQRTSAGAWVQLGEDITGLSANELFGWSVTVQMIGMTFRLVAGAPSSDNEKGLVRVFDWNGSVWEQNGVDIVGLTNLGRCGESVALSEDGKVLAVGASGTAFVSGLVRVFRLQAGAWMEDSHAFLGQAPADAYGMAVALSKNGSVMAVGSGHADYGTGQIDVYKYDKPSGAWTTEGLSLEGLTNDNFGSAVALSGDGLRVAGGAPSAMFDGSVAQAGVVRVFDRDDGSSED